MMQIESHSTGPRVDAATMRIAETFVSRQGEGARTGNSSFFIRTSGCNLRCWFCDTPYASWRPEGDAVDVETLVQWAVGAGVNDVVLTGGEPLLWESCQRLTDAVRQHGLHVTIETAGTIDRDVAPDLLSLSPKLQSSGPNAVAFPAWAQRHADRRLPIDTMRTLIGQAIETQIKFVVSDVGEFAEIESIVTALDAATDQIWIMPEATSLDELDAAQDWLRPAVDQRGWRYADRMQIHWYGNRRGT